MDSIAPILKLFKNFNIQKMFNEVMKGLHNEIIELNQIEQLSEGIDANETRIITDAAEFQRNGFPYSTMAVNERRAKGLQVDNVDLNFTGKFWRTFKVVKVKGGWEIRANFNLYGEDIRRNFDSSYDFTGLTQNNLEQLVYSSVLPELEKKIRNYFKI